MNVTRRAALQTVGSALGVLYGTVAVTTQGGKVLTLAMDDISAIIVRGGGQTVQISPAELVLALRSGKDS